MAYFMSEYKSRRATIKHYPGYARVVKVEGGYLVFQYEDDYRIWKNQK